MYKRILMAYNGTREGRTALLECAEIAAFAKAETHLLSVATMPSSMFLTEGFLPEELIDEERKRMQEVLDEGVASLKTRGFTAQGHLAVGEPIEEICRCARELDVDLVVVGHRQETSFAARWWKGSIGATLLDYVPCSLLVAMEHKKSAA